MILDQLGGKTVAEKADFKATEIAKFDFSTVHTDDKYGVELEIQSLNKITGGVEVFAKAFKNGEPLGFGDGSIEIERFRVFNPPILITDDVGDVVRTWTDPDGNTKEYRYREDPVEAVKHTLAHTALVSGKTGTKIVPGKVGNTTTTCFPSAGAVNPVDGMARRLSVDEVFSSIRTGAGADASATDTTDEWALKASTNSNNYIRYTRNIFGFDTSSIPDGDTISSATFSFYAVDDALSQNGVTTMDLTAGNPASATTLAASDYNIANHSATKLATGINTDTVVLNQYNDIVLNASGIAAISKTGTTFLAGRLGWDVDNTTPTWSSDGKTGPNVSMADVAGTTQDPKLVITHAAAPTTKIESWDNLAKGSIEKFNGLGIASVETIDNIY